MPIDAQDMIAFAIEENGRLMEALGRVPRRDEILAVFKDRLTQLQEEAALALLAAERGEIDGAHAHLAEAHMQFSAVMHVFWHYRTELTVK